MEPFLRTFAVYVFLLILFRINGKRSLAQITAFDFVMLLIISEATQQALIDGDESITNSFIILSFFALDILFSFLKEKFKNFEKMIDGVPIIIVEDGKPIKERLKKSRVDEGDILENARKLQGLERMEQIKYAILERDGNISIIPK